MELFVLDAGRGTDFITAHALCTVGWLFLCCDTEHNLHHCAAFIFISEHFLTICNTIYLFICKMFFFCFSQTQLLKSNFYVYFSKPLFWRSKPFLFHHHLLSYITVTFSVYWWITLNILVCNFFFLISLKYQKRKSTSLRCPLLIYTCLFWHILYRISWIFVNKNYFE